MMMNYRKSGRTLKGVESRKSMGKTGKTFAMARSRNGLCEAFQKLWMWRSRCMFIKAILSLGDRAVVEVVSKNPYL